MVTVNISNKTAYVLIGILVLVIASGSAIALYSNEWQVHGHDASEIEGGGGSSSCQWKSVVAYPTLRYMMDEGATGFCYYLDGSGYTVGFLFEGTKGSTEETTTVSCDAAGAAAQVSEGETIYFYSCG